MPEESPFELVPLGDSAVIVRLGDRITPEIHRRVVNLLAGLDASAIETIVEQAPAYASVLLRYDPLAFHVGTSPLGELRRLLRTVMKTTDLEPQSFGKEIVIPVCFDSEFAPDLGTVAQHTGLTTEQVIMLHTGAEYLVHMIGFLPGFPYLGGLPARLATPRREVPRLAVPAGSVGIGGSQTGVYPIESPGGWQLIGRTPLRLFNAANDPPALLAAGDHVRFAAITRGEYLRMVET